MLQNVGFSMKEVCMNAFPEFIGGSNLRFVGDVLGFMKLQIKTSHVVISRDPTAILSDPLVRSNAKRHVGVNNPEHAGSNEKPLGVKRGEYGAAPEFKGGGKRDIPGKTYGPAASSHMRKCGSDPARNRTRLASVGGESSSRFATAAPYGTTSHPSLSTLLGACHSVCPLKYMQGNKGANNSPLIRSAAFLNPEHSLEHPVYTIINSPVVRLATGMSPASECFAPTKLWLCPEYARRKAEVNRLRARVCALNQLPEETGDSGYYIRLNVARDMANKQFSNRKRNLALNYSLHVIEVYVVFKWIRGIFGCLNNYLEIGLRNNLEETIFLQRSRSGVEFVTFRIRARNATMIIRSVRARDKRTGNLSLRDRGANPRPSDHKSATLPLNYEEKGNPSEPRTSRFIYDRNPFGTSPHQASCSHRLVKTRAGRPGLIVAIFLMCNRVCLSTYVSLLVVKAFVWSAVVNVFVQQW
ncbi:hypothetical protein PR048_007665 [Dryococelus australis]|uniref:Uncharacterized protein n=1 Tax=Dryococelus australis TaxID=614101 RepID=A0ABQ9HUW4_9NEOP|nr:hypothetical protein PR048_007665 [Dryococelus australis]